MSVILDNNQNSWEHEVRNKDMFLNDMDRHLGTPLSLKPMSSNYYISEEQRRDNEVAMGTTAIVAGVAASGVSLSSAVGIASTIGAATGFGAGVVGVAAGAMIMGAGAVVAGIAVAGITKSVINKVKNGQSQPKAHRFDEKRQITSAQNENGKNSNGLLEFTRTAINSTTHMKNKNEAIKQTDSLIDSLREKSENGEDVGKQTLDALYKTNIRTSNQKEQLKELFTQNKLQQFTKEDGKTVDKKAMINSIEKDIDSIEKDIFKPVAREINASVKKNVSNLISQNKLQIDGNWAMPIEINHQRTNEIADQIDGGLRDARGKSQGVAEKEQGSNAQGNHERPRDEKYLKFDAKIQEFGKNGDLEGLKGLSNVMDVMDNTGKSKLFDTISDNMLNSSIASNKIDTLSLEKKIEKFSENDKEIAANIQKSVMNSIDKMKSNGEIDGGGNLTVLHEKYSKDVKKEEPKIEAKKDKDLKFEKKAEEFGKNGDLESLKGLSNVMDVMHTESKDSFKQITSKLMIDSSIKGKTIDTKSIDKSIDKFSENEELRKELKSSIEKTLNAAKQNGEIFQNKSGALEIVPGMGDSFKAGLKEPVKKATKTATTPTGGTALSMQEAKKEEPKRDGWVAKNGGYENLDKHDKEVVDKSYNEWKSEKDEKNKTLPADKQLKVFDKEGYVNHVQTKFQQEKANAGKGQKNTPENAHQNAQKARVEKAQTKGDVNSNSKYAIAGRNQAQSKPQNTPQKSPERGR